MDLINWLPSITSTSLLAIALWLSRKLIETRLTRSVEHEFNTKLETIRAEFREKEELLRADLRAKEIEITDLRSGAMSAMASRQVALDNRRLEAVDQIWSALTALAPAKFISSVMSIIKFDKVVQEAEKNSKFREIVGMMINPIDIKKIDLSGAARARPFVSKMTWALFSAYSAITMQAVLKSKMLVSGIDMKGMIDQDVTANLLKVALPDQRALIDKFGDSDYHFLLEELEGRLLDEMRKMLQGIDADKATLEQAAEILRLSNTLSDSARLESMQTKNAGNVTLGSGAP